LLGGAALGFLTMVGLWLDFNRTAASLAYVIVLKNRAKKAGLLTRLGCHSFRATGITSICSTAASSSTLSRSAAPLPYRDMWVVERATPCIPLEGLILN
jgi:hypothetical protein